MFLSYLLAGVSFALPSEFRCGRCIKQGHTHTAHRMKAGASCPLSHHKKGCHDSAKKQAGQIQLCPDGCLRYDGEGGEVPSLAKFLSSPPVLVLPRLFVGLTQSLGERLSDRAAFPPPDPPPSLLT
jgi:hypothetical protein